MRKKEIALLLSVIMLVSLLTACGREEAVPEEPEETGYTAKTYELSDTEVTKDETVYVNLAPDGTQKKITVSDHIHTAMPQVRIHDMSDLTDISDVKTFLEPVWEKGELYWDMESTDLYYSGISDKETPISVSIQYLLDGEEISASKLSGKSGRLTMEIDVKNTLRKSVSVNGGSYELCCPIIMAGGMILPEDVFQNVTATNGIMLGDGAHQLVLMLGVPGMDESLGISSLGLPLISDSMCRTHYTVTADVTEFSLGNIMFAAVPFSSIEALSSEHAADGLSGVKEMLAQIEGLLTSLASQSVEDVVSMLYGDISQAERLINSVSDASELYESNKVLIETLGKYVTDENLNTLNRLINDLDNLDLSALESMQQLQSLGIFRELNSLLSKLLPGLNNLATFTNDAMNALPLFQSLEEDLNNPEVKQAMENMPSTVQKLRELMQVLEDSRQLMDDLQKLADSSYTKELLQLLDTVNEFTGMDSITEAQAQHIAGRMKEWLAFGQSYRIFSAKDAKAASTVIFIYKTESIA